MPRVRSDVQVRPRHRRCSRRRTFGYLGVDGSQNRGNQTGYEVEGGVRFEGARAAIELFVAGERRIDPYPLEFGDCARGSPRAFAFSAADVWTIIDEYAPPEPIDAGSPCSRWRPSSRWR